MNHKKIIIIGVVILGILALLVFSMPSNKAVSPNIMYITQPVSSFSGIVDKINGNNVTISQKLTLFQNNTAQAPLALNPANQTSPFPTPKTMNVTYNIVITDKTQISQPSPFVNYLFKTVNLPLALPANNVSKLTVKDIKVGQMITVNTMKDLRTLVGNTFEATNISIPQIANTLNGKIVSIDGNIMILKGFAVGASLAVPGVASAPQEKEYRVNITSDTEISRTSFTTPALLKPGEMPPPPKNEKLSTSDLKNDMQVTVYAAEDVTMSQVLTALRIEPPQVILDVVLISPTPSASTTPSLIP